jgi:anti-sigma factor RsiW
MEYEQDNESRAKRKRLDELFADMPHLSTTMKARLLHERLNSQIPLDPASAPELPHEAYVRDVPARGPRPAQEPAERPKPAPAVSRPISLQEAARLLQNPLPSGYSDAWTLERLHALREQVLRKWRSALPD